MEYVIIILLFVVLFTSNGGRGAGQQLEILRRLRRVERQLDSIARHLGVELPAELDPAEGSDEVRRLVRAGQVIQAIKVYREETGVGLAEAKAAVDRIRAQLGGP